MKNGFTPPGEIEGVQVHILGCIERFSRSYGLALSSGLPAYEGASHG